MHAVQFGFSGATVDQIVWQILKNIDNPAKKPRRDWNYSCLFPGFHFFCVIFSSTAHTA
jgi:hypothetical protein